MYKHIEKDEKKLTDDEIAKAIVQSIEYSKTITYFDEWGNCKSIMMTDILDFINRLKEGRKTFFRIAKQRYEEKRELEKKVEEQKAEIERLKEYNLNLNGMNLEFIDKNAELQKQVDGLKEKTTDLHLDKQELMNEISEHKNAHERLNEAYVNLNNLYQQAVKDTAKEIYAQVLEWSPVGENYHWFITTLENWLKEKYGVEVE